MHEVWRHNGSSIEFDRLVDVRYARAPTSYELTGLDAVLINRYLDQPLQAGKTTFIRAFRNEISEVNR